MQAQDRPPAPAAGDDDAAKRLTKLLQERRDAAEVAFALRMKRVEAGSLLADNVFFAAALWLHESEMELCRTKAERVRACEAHLKRMDAVDPILQAQFEAGKINQVDRVPGTYYRLDAVIRLERAKGK